MVKAVAEYDWLEAQQQVGVKLRYIGAADEASVRERLRNQSDPNLVIDVAAADKDFRDLAPPRMLSGRPRLVLAQARDRALLASDHEESGHDLCRWQQRVRAFSELALLFGGAGTGGQSSAAGEGCQSPPRACCSA